MFHSSNFLPIKKPDIASVLFHFLIPTRFIELRPLKDEYTDRICLTFELMIGVVRHCNYEKKLWRSSQLEKISANC